ncbi:SNAPIN protein homolog isoform X2 [Cimex lectularius]|uniref:Biogenesis of lysosome-related organelles complex 1 subunit 7 n=1 Tax=Cimex lectularius TaxID=79782 RepID=A0A8I6RRW4_CIMLE|nr:SNAPIN protein homolog isoform X2 [Cimex lectularius]
MEQEIVSNISSLEDKTDDFCDNPTRDSLAEGLMSVIKPTIDQLDERVKATRLSQLELKKSLDALTKDLKEIAAEKNCPLDLELYANKLVSTRHKILVVGNILQASQDRLDKLQARIQKETQTRTLSDKSSPVGEQPN